MTEAGLTADVAALRLRDAVNDAADTAQSFKPGPVIVSEAELPDIVVPGAGISLQKLATEILSLFNSENRHKLTGEFVAQKDEISLRVRLDGKPFYESRWFPDDHVDDLFKDAAPTVLRLMRPFVFAVSMYRQHKYSVLREVLKSITVGNQSCEWPRRIVQADACHDYVDALNLYGLALDPLNCSEEVTECREVTRHPEQAIPEFRKVIELEPNFNWAYIHLGRAQTHLEQWDEAIAAFKQASSIDPTWIVPHVSLGELLANLGRLKAAKAEYEAAKALDSSFVIPLLPDAPGSNEGRL